MSHERSDLAPGYSFPVFARRSFHEGRNLISRTCHSLFRASSRMRTVMVPGALLGMILTWGCSSPPAWQDAGMMAMHCSECDLGMKLDTMMKCKCGNEVKVGDLYVTCPTCGAEIRMADCHGTCVKCGDPMSQVTFKVKCPRCGGEFDAKAVSCPHCVAERNK